jgi:DNA-binding transcriptional regulator YiaG
MSPAELKTARHRMALSQKAFGAELDLSTRAIAYYEAGERPIPGYIDLALEALFARRAREAQGNG